jgi:type II secretory pathway pseudopilin PulG
MTMIRSLVTLVLVAGLSACGPSSGKDQVDADQVSRALEQQRSEVRQAARVLVLAAERSLPGTTRSSSSGYRGCESAFNEEFRNFHYLAQARIDTGPGSGASYLAKLRPVLEDAGFTVDAPREEPNGFTTMAAAKGDLSASFVHTGGAFVGLDVSGPCIDVPEGERDAWLHRDEPDPEIR